MAQSTQYSEIRSNHGATGVMGLEVLQTQGFKTIEFLGKAAFEPSEQNESSFLYYAKKETEPFLYLFTSFNSGASLRFYKFHPGNICRLEEFGFYPSLGKEPDFTRVRSTTSTFEYDNGMIVQRSGSNVKQIPKREFLSTHNMTYIAMHETLKADDDQLKAKLGAETYSALVESLEGTISELKQLGIPTDPPIKPEPVEIVSPEVSPVPDPTDEIASEVKPSIKHIKLPSKRVAPRKREFKFPNSISLEQSAIPKSPAPEKKESVFAQPIIPLGAHLEFTDISRQEEVANPKPWCITANYDDYRLEVDFEASGQLTRISLTEHSNANNWQYFEFGRIPKTKSEITVSLISSAGEGKENEPEEKELPLKTAANFIEPITEQLAHHAATTPLPKNTRLVLKKLLANIQAWKGEIGFGSR